MNARASALRTPPRTGKAARGDKGKSLLELLRTPLYESRTTDNLKNDDVTFLFRSLATLVDSGVPLPKALGALAQEKAMERSRHVIQDLQRRLESGSSFSAALQAHSHSFDRVTLNQVKVGERSGTLAATLDHIAVQREKSGKLRAEVGKKLAYPAMLTLVGSGVIAFLLGYVVPVFEETYSSANVPLPEVTRLMISVGGFAQSYGLYLIGAAIVGIVAFKKLREREGLALAIDRGLLRAPLVGQWLRDIAILEFVDVLTNLMGSGYTLIDSLAEARNTVSNRAVKLCVRDLHAGVDRGERFSRTVEDHAELFPPMVSQLIIVGERTGNLLNAARHIQRHLEDEIERKATALVGVIEPVLTISLAAAVAVILLAIYLPMFDMINTVG